MSWQIFISLRYFSARRKERFISVISLISMAGIALGVAALIIVISVMTGFDEELKDKIIGTYSHIEITSNYAISPSGQLTDKILKTKHVEAASYFLNAQALVRCDNSVIGVVAKGVVAEDEARVKKIGRYIKKGSLDLRQDGIIIGSELASRLRVKVGDRISLISPTNLKPQNVLSLVSASFIEGKDFRVSGIFTSGMYEYDMNLVYVDISKAQALMGTEGLASGVAVKVDDLFNVSGVKRDLQERLGAPYVVRTWIDCNRNFLEAIKLEKTVMFVILTLIVAVACFNIASTLIMTVLEKTKDIGILKAIGAANHDIMLIFATQGAIIGFMGTLIGTAVGIVACWCLKTYKFIDLPKDIYYIEKLPVKTGIQDVGIIMLSSIVISLLAALYPAYRASRLDPVEALRYE